MAYTTAWRITSARFTKADGFSGDGGLISAARWHDKGIKIVYVSENLSLAVLETYVHLSHVIHVKKFKVYKVEIPENLILRPDLSDLVNTGPKSTTTISRATQKYGTQWLKNMRSVALAVPSVVVPLENNYLLNPNHPDYDKLIIHDALDHKYDPRL